MAVTIAVSNILVSIPLGEWLTLGALSFPVAFLISDLVNRFKGAASARKVVLVGFAVGIAVTLILANWRIALASGSAFLTGQLLDIAIFDRLRNRAWWQAPAISSIIGVFADTWIFFFLAFYGTESDWVKLALGDLGFKILIALCLLPPYRMTLSRYGKI